MHYFIIKYKERCFDLTLNGYTQTFNYSDYTVKEAKQLMINSLVEQR